MNKAALILAFFLAFPVFLLPMIKPLFLFLGCGLPILKRLRINAG